MLLAALRAMAIQRRHQRPGDLEFDAAAQAAAVDGGHGALRFRSFPIAVYRLA
jgi:hypothetical protein